MRGEWAPVDRPGQPPYSSILEPRHSPLSASSATTAAFAFTARERAPAQQDTGNAGEPDHSAAGHGIPCGPPQISEGRHPPGPPSRGSTPASWLRGTVRRLFPVALCVSLLFILYDLSGAAPGQLAALALGVPRGAPEEPHAKMPGRVLDGAETAVGAPAACLEEALASAEAQYQLNFQRLLERTRRVRAKKQKVTKVDLQAEHFLPTYPCALEARFGLWGDGGKWVCLRHYGAGSAPPVVVSIGSRGDESFERDLHERLKAFSHTFDFSLSQADKARMGSHRFLRFYDAGLLHKDGIADLDRRRQLPQQEQEQEQGRRRKKQLPLNATFYSLPELLQVIGIAYADIFKIDCEGCEHGVVRDMARLYTRATAPFGQIQMEVHNMRFAKHHVDLLTRLEGLGYRMFHTELNPLWGGDGYEIALIHESLVKPRSS